MATVGTRAAPRRSGLRPRRAPVIVRVDWPRRARVADIARRRRDQGEGEPRRARGRAGRGARREGRGGPGEHDMTTALGKDLVGLERLSPDQIRLILDTAEPFKEVSERPIKKVPALRGKTIVNLFFEASTRTRISFEFAEKRLSADTVNVAASGSAVQKGETLVDTARNLEAMRIDMVVI